MPSFSSMALGQYIPADSPLHRLDPRSKVLLTLVAMIAIFMTASFSSLALWALFFAFVVFLSKIPLRAVLRSVRPIAVLIVFTSVLHLFWTPGDVIAQLGFLKITQQGIVMALRMGLRLLFLVLYAGMLTLTTSPSELSDGLERLMRPLQRVGVPAHEIAMMITIALRFIPTLFEETDRILKAQISRGADFDSGGLLRRAKSYIPVLIPLFVLVFQRADTLASAMESRCYRGGRGRVRMYPLRWGAKDSRAVFLFFLFVLLTFFVDGRLF